MTLPKRNGLRKYNRDFNVPEFGNKVLLENGGFNGKGLSFFVTNCDLIIASRVLGWWLGEHWDWHLCCDYCVVDLRTNAPRLHVFIWNWATWVHGATSRCHLPNTFRLNVAITLPLYYCYEMNKFILSQQRMCSWNFYLLLISAKR